MEYGYSSNTFNTLKSIINDSSLVEEIYRIEEQRFNTIWIIQAILYSLSDNFYPLKGIEPEIIAMLARMIVHFYKSSLKVSLDATIDFDFEEMMKYKERPVYYVDIEGTYREASISEVESGLLELVNIPEKALDDTSEKMMNLLSWAVTGRYKYFINAGHTCTYKDNKLVETDCQQIIAAASDIRKLSDWLDEDVGYENAKKALLRMKKLGKYKYQSVVSNEIKEDCSITYIVYYLGNNMPFRVKGDLFKCKKILEARKNKRYLKFSTEEKITLRKGYKELLDIKNGCVNKEEASAEILDDIKELCSTIKQGVADGLLPENDFSLKVIFTVDKSGYTKCSVRQRQILVEACNKIGLAKGKNEQTKLIKDRTSGSEDISIGNLSDLLGEGLLE